MSLRDEILALDPALLATRDDAAIAAAVSVGRTRLVKTEIGKGMVIATIGLVAGNALLDVIDDSEDYRHVKQLVANGWLDIGSPLAHGALDACATAGVITQGHADALKALAGRDDPVTALEVARLFETGEV